MNRKRICYFGIYAPSAPRDRIYLDELKKNGYEIVLCVDNSAGLLKFWRLWKKHRELKNQYDILWVGYLSAMAVSLAWLISRKKKIIFNALCSWYETVVLDRGTYSKWSPKAWIIWLFDFKAFLLSDVIFVESESQKRYVEKHYFVNKNKLHSVFTGVLPDVFFIDKNVQKRERFTVIFRGIFLPATGVKYVVEASKILKDEPIDFVMIGWGDELPMIRKMISEYNLPNLKLITEFMETKVLRETLLSAHVMLGQFGDHERLDRTIQNKTFEALALGQAYITRDSISNREILVDGKNALFVKFCDPHDIAEKIIYLRDNTEARERLGLEARKTYEEHLRPEILVEKIEKFI